MKEIKLSNGLLAFVSEEDYDLVSKNKWSITKNGYAKRAESKNGDHKTILMHRQILGVGRDQIVDHKDRNKLNNTRENLRIATRSQNMMNQKVRDGRKFKGVSFNPKTGKYRTRFSYEKKLLIDQNFDTEKDAVQSYNQHITLFAGEFALVNP